jgi:hypothetical protein
MSNDEEGLTWLEVETIAAKGTTQAKIGWLKPRDQNGHSHVKVKPMPGAHGPPRARPGQGQQHAGGSAPPPRRSATWSVPPSLASLASPARRQAQHSATPGGPGSAAAAEGAGVFEREQPTSRKPPRLVGKHSVRGGAVKGARTRPEGSTGETFNPLAENSAEMSAQALAQSSEWVEKHSAKHNRSYWVNKTTEERTWVDPNREAQATRARQPTRGAWQSQAMRARQPTRGARQSQATRARQPTGGAQPAQPSAWVQGYSDQHQRKFWTNRSTGESTWYDPARTTQPPRTGELEV